MYFCLLIMVNHRYMQVYVYCECILPPSSKLLSIIPPCTDKNLVGSGHSIKQFSEQAVLRKTIPPHTQVIDPGKSRCGYKLYRPLYSCFIDDITCQYLTIYGSQTCQMTSYRHVLLRNQDLITLQEDNLN